MGNNESENQITENRSLETNCYKSFHCFNIENSQGSGKTEALKIKNSNSP